MNYKNGLHFYLGWHHPPSAGAYGAGEKMPSQWSRLMDLRQSMLKLRATMTDCGPDIRTSMKMEELQRHPVDKKGAELGVTVCEASFVSPALDDATIRTTSLSQRNQLAVILHSGLIELHADTGRSQLGDVAFGPATSASEMLVRFRQQPVSLFRSRRMAV